jgi:peptidoglycan/LPS O-acetylase OafA/YrhL
MTSRGGSGSRYSSDGAGSNGHVPLSADWGVNNFDMIRLLAALQVAVMHAITYLKPAGFLAHLVQFGLNLFPGVPIFFVISGLLISKSYEQADSIRHYYQNRCLRIFPALWVCLVVSLGVICAIGVGSLGTVSTREWLLWWAAQMSIFQSYEADFLRSLDFSGGLNSSLWTIPIELEFYLLLPALYGMLRLHRHRGHMLVFAVLVVSLAVELLLMHGRWRFPRVADYSFLQLTLVPNLWMFLVGVLIQRNWTAVRGWLAGRAHWWLLGYLLLCMLTTALRIDIGGNDINPVFLLPLAGLVISVAMSAPGLSDKILQHRDISYGLYIYHMLVIHLMVQFSLRSVSAVIAISLGLAIISWTLVERPFLQRKQRALRAVSNSPMELVRRPA